jgi:AraC-like DNA-binding protein
LNANTEPVDRRFERGEIARLLDGCQVIAGRFGDLTFVTLLAEMDRLVLNLPPSLNRAELVTIRGVMAHLLARLVRSAGIERRHDITRLFLHLADAPATISTWRPQWVRATSWCATLLREADRDSRPVVDTRVTRMLQCIQLRFVDSTLTMRDVAQLTNLSPSHAARLLKRQTGTGFVTHLHRLRVDLARRLLIETVLSVKEISAAAGYTHPSQLSRSFKLAYGESPVSFRTMQSRARSA